MTKYKYSLEIDVQGYECNSTTGAWQGYGTIVTEGNTLEELQDNATVDVIDQNGGEIDVRPADKRWMQDLIETEALNKVLQFMNQEKES